MFLFWVAIKSLDFYTLHGKTFRVPDFKGKLLSEAKQIAEKANLKLQVIDSIYNPRGKKGSIVEQTPPVGFQVKKNRRIFLTTISYSREMVEMPNLIGNSMIQAKNDLEYQGLSVGKLKFIKHKHKFLVQAQEINGKPIAHGTKIEKGTAIDLVLGDGNDREESKTFVPNFLGNNLRQAKNKATRAALNIGEIIYDETLAENADSLKAMVWQQEPKMNEKREVQFGTPINLWLTNNKNKVEIALLAQENETVAETDSLNTTEIPEEIQ